MNNDLLPSRIETITAVAERDRPLYESAAVGEGYTLIAGGKQLQKLRAAMRDSASAPSLPRPARGKEPTLSKRDWMITLGAAAPQERKHLLAAAGRGDIRIK